MTEIVYILNNVYVFTTLLKYVNASVFAADVNTVIGNATGESLI